MNQGMKLFRARNLVIWGRWLVVIVFALDSVLRAVVSIGLLVRPGSSQMAFLKAKQMQAEY